MEETICERAELNLEWKAEGVIDGESEGGDCDEVMRALQDEVNQDDVRVSEQITTWRNEGESWFLLKN